MSKSKIDYKQLLSSRTIKSAVVPAPGGQAPPPPMPPMPPMDPSMMGGGAPPAGGAPMGMDPSMMGGAPQMGMDPAMMGGAPPADPAMMGGDPAAAAAPPAGGDPAAGGDKGGKGKKPDVAVELQKLTDMVHQILDGQSAIIEALNVALGGGSGGAAPMPAPTAPPPGDPAAMGGAPQMGMDPSMMGGAPPQGGMVAQASEEFNVNDLIPDPEQVALLKSAANALRAR